MNDYRRIDARELPVADMDGDTYDPSLDRVRLNGQNLKVYLLMRDEVWRRLSQIAWHVHAPEASVSARLRDLRKEKFGEHTVNRRRVTVTGLWEYQLIPNDPQRELF
jgi:hypothetical protein